MKAGSHLFIVAGVPAAGKTSLLINASAGLVQPFGEDYKHVIPRHETLNQVGEGSDTQKKLEAGFWLTLWNILDLNEHTSLPTTLLFHLDLMLVYLLFRENRLTFPSTPQVTPALAAFFDLPAIAHYDRVSVATVHAPYPELQRRWAHRFSKGLPADTVALLAEKNTIFTESLHGERACESIYEAWGAWLQQLQNTGKIVTSNRFAFHIRDDRSASNSAAKGFGP
jgi:hypothetical protein